MRKPLKRAGLFACVLVGGCGVGGPPDPTQEDATKAMPQVLQHTVSTWFQPIGTPFECTAGNVNGTPVRSCKVCVTNLEFIIKQGPYGLSRHTQAARLRRANYSITFKRAVSYDQPAVTPTDSSQGVWVPIVGEPTMYGPPSPPSFEEIVGKDLEPADVEPFGITMSYYRHGVSLVVRRPGYSGGSAANIDLLNALGTPEAVTRHKAIVGDCNGMRGTLDGS